MCLTWRGSRTTKLRRNSVSSLSKCLFCCASVRPCLAPRLGPPGSPPAHSLCYRRSLFFFFPLPFPPPHTSSLQNRALPCLALPASSILLFFTPLHSSSAPAWAGRLPGWGPRWCSGKRASSGVSEPAGWQRGPSVADMAAAGPGTCR